MNSRKSNRTFLLETLEPRILLSGDGALPLSSCAFASQDFAPASENFDHAGSTSADTDLAYDPSAELTPIFDAAPSENSPGSDAKSATETGSDSSSSQTQVAAEILTNDNSASVSPETSEPALEIAPDSAETLSITEQLTESLRAANGPPEVAGVEVHLTPDIALELDNTLVLNAGDSLTGSGTLTVGVINHGLVSPGNSPGIDNLPTFSQASDGLTLIEIAGTSGAGNPNGHDRINVSGLAELDGTLQIQLLNGFIPSLGDSFIIMTWGSRAGEFARYLGTAPIPTKPDLAFKPVYNAGNLTLQVIQTPTIIPGAQAAFDTGFDALQDVADLLENAGQFAEEIPLIGEQIGDIIDLGTTITNTIRTQLFNLLNSVTRQAEITAGIASWDGDVILGATIHVKGVLGHYGAVDTDPFWYDVDLEIELSPLSRALEAGTSAVLNAVFDPNPMVQVDTFLDFDFSFGLDSGFFVEIDALSGRAEVDVTGLAGFEVDLAPPGSPLSLDVINGSVDLDASVTATPDSSILAGGRITLATLTSIAGGTINVADAFNLDEAGTIDAELTLDGALTGFAFDYVGTHTVRIESDDLFSGNDPDLTIEVDGALVLLNQTVTGLFTLRKTATETIITAENVEIELNAGPSDVRILRANNGSGTFLVVGGELAGTATLTIAQGPDIPNISIAGTVLNLAFNTASSAVPIIDGETVNLPAGPYFRLSGNAVISLTIPAVSLIGDFVFEPFDPTPATPNSGDEVVTVGVANLAFSFSAATEQILQVTDGSGAFVFTEDGVVGEADADVTATLPGLALSGTFSLDLNDTNAPFAATVDVNGTPVAINVVAGPYLRVLAEDATLTVLGFDLTGDFVFEQSETADNDEVVTVAADNVDFPLGTLTGDLVNVSNGSGAFIITDDGIVGEADADVMLGVASLSLVGTFSFRINETDADVDEMIDIAGNTIHLDVPAGPYLQVNAENAVLTVLGVAMSGDFSFEQRETEDGDQLVTIMATDVSFDFGDTVGDLLSMNNGSALFLFTDSGAAGQGMIDVGVNIFGETYSDTFTFAFNNTNLPVDEIVDWEGDEKHIDLPEGPLFQVAGVSIDISFMVAGHSQTFTGDFVFSQIDDGSGKYVTIGASNLSTTLGGGAVTLSVTGGTGAFVLQTSGIAGIATVASAVLSGAGGISVTASDLELRVNSTGGNVGPIDVPISEDPADNVTVEFTGPYYANFISITGAASVDLAGYVTMAGIFSFEISDSNPNAFKVGVEELMLDLKAGSLTVASFTNGTGAFLITSGGIAGVAQIDFEVGVISISGDVMLEVNTTTSPVNTSVTNASGPTLINLTDTEYLRLCVNGYLHLGSVALPFDFIMQVDTGSGDVEFREKGSNNLLLSVASDGTVTTGLSFDDFAAPGPFEFIGLLRQLANWLSLFSDADVFDVEIPFTDGLTIGEALDWSQLFLDEIFSHMISVEAQSRTLSLSSSGNLAAAVFRVQIGTDAPVVVTVTGNYNNLNDLVVLFNSALVTSGLSSSVVARINKDDKFVLALTPAAASETSTLNLRLNPTSSGDQQIKNLGFGPADNDVNTTDQVAIETARYDTEEFFVELGNLLGLTIAYDPVRSVYTYTVNEGASYSVSLPFNFGGDLGAIAGAELSGTLSITAAVNFTFTLGFDLSAAEVPRILTSSFIPTPANGRISEDAHFEVFLNDDLAPLLLTLPKSYTDGTDPMDLLPNNTIADLAADLNRVFREALHGSTPLDELLYAQKAGNGLAISVLNEDHDNDGALGMVNEDLDADRNLDPGEDVDGDGVLDRIEDVNGNGVLDNQLGLINRVIIRSLQDDVFSTELGFGAEAIDLDNNAATTHDQYFQTISKSRMRGLFVENVGLSGSISVVTTTPITGEVRFGFVEISTTGGSFGTLAYDGVTPAPVTVSVSLEDQTTGNTRFYISELFNNLSSVAIGNILEGPTLTGSFLARLPNISVGGLGFSFPLGSNPEISLWIPDITELTYNEDPYDGTNEGIFLTFPDLGHLNNFSKITFVDIIRALDVVADNLSQLSAFSFLNTKLPFIDLSINDMIDYAARFADIVEAASSGNADSLQEMLDQIEDDIEELFNLGPNVLDVSLDDNGITSDPVTSGGTAGSPATATYNPNGHNNGLIFTATSNGTALNGVTIRVIGVETITDSSAEATWDPTNKILTIGINGSVTTANAVIAAVAALPGTPWVATLVANDNTIGTNTGAGTYTTTALRFEFNFTTGFADTLPFQLDLQSLVAQLAGQNSIAAEFLELATNFIQIQGSGVLTVSAGATLTLDFGIDLTDPCHIRPFFYDTTGVVLTAKVLGTDIEFEASLGSVVGIFIRDGSVTLDADGNPATGPTDGDVGAEFRLGLRDNNGDGRHYFTENWFDVANIDLHLTGGVGAILPIFAPLAATPLSGDEDTNGDGYPDNQLVIDIPDLVRLFLDTRADAGVAIVRVPGANNNLNITRIAGDTDNFSVIFQQNAGLGATAMAAFNSNILTVSINSGTTTATAVKTAIEALGGFAVTFLPDDPMGANPGTGTVTVSKLILITPDFGTLFDNLDFCAVIDSSAGLLLDGLDELLGSIQDGLNDIVSNTRLPLVGDGLGDAADFIGRFRDGLLADLREAIDSAGSASAAIEIAIKQAFWNTLGPGGIDILVDFETGDPLDEALGFEQLDVTLDCDNGLVVNLRLGSEIALVDTSANPIDLDIGVDGFGLEISGNVKVAIGFDLKFGFGLSPEDGFFFNSSAPADDPELRLYFEATIPGLAASGQLLFLQLDASDDPDDPSSFIGQFAIDLMDPNNDGKLTFAEMSSSGTEFSDIISAQLEATADLNINLSASFGGNTAFPRVLADFHLDWHWDLENGAEHPQISFENVALDLGSFISDFLGPILEEIRKVTEPLQPIIDIVTARLPVLSDLAGEDITLLDLAAAFGLLEPSTIQFIDSVIKIIELINDIGGLGEGSILIPFGSFALGDDGSGNMKKIQLLEDLSEIDVAGAIAAASGPGVSQTYKNASAGFVGDVGSLDNFSIPIFDSPLELFNLFIGEPVRLIEWNMPTFKFEFTYVQSIPIYPPLYAQFGGSIGATINIGFGYDTFGIQKFIASEDKNVIDLLDGFYVIDFDASGNERNELELSGEIFAGASIDLLIVEVGVRGGIFATIGFDLNDINHDGKVRVSEIIANAQQDPRCIFNIHGELGLFLEAFLKVDLFFFSIEKEWRFAEITLFEFDITCPVPILAEKIGTDLTLNIGSRAGDREEIDTNDNAETFIVQHVSGTAGNEKVSVQWGNYTVEFDGVGRIIVLDAGNGNDLIDLRGVLSPSEVHGGAGNDTIYLSDGDGSEAYGDGGTDTIIAGLGLNVVLYGGEGNDLLTGTSVAIEIHGDGGNDTITGSPQGDMLFGDAGADLINAGDGDDHVEGGANNDIIEAGAGHDFVLGGSGVDVIRGGRGIDYLNGDDGDDQLSGGADNDLLVGGNGADKIYGHGGIDLLIGDNFGTINGTAVASLDLAAALAAIANSGISVENLTGSGNDFMVGGGNIDVLFGGAGNDFLYGGNFLEQGVTEVIEEDANDFFDGGTGHDTIFGDDSMGRAGDRNTGIAIKSAIFYDNNLNGIRDADETGFGGVTVQLRRQSDSQLIATETTKSNGSFEFLGLDPNNYYLVFSLPAGLGFTTRYVGGATKPDDSDDDSDVDNTGTTEQFDVDFDETEEAVAAGYTGNPVITVDAVSVSEGNGSQTAAVFTVRLSGPAIGTLSIPYSIINGTATSTSGDFLALSGTLIIAHGELVKQINVTINGDTSYEDHEQFILNLVNPFGGAPIQAFGTIINDDAIPRISIRDYVPAQGASETDKAIFVVTLSNPSQSAITVEWRTDAALTFQVLDPANPARPTPLLGADFVQDADLLTFQPGETTQIIEITLLHDNLDEFDEHFFVDLFNPTFATISDSRGYGIIPDDDAEVSVTIVPLIPIGGPFNTQVLEGNSSSTFVPVRVQLSGVSGKPIVVTYATNPGTAVESVYSLSSELRDYVGAPNATTDAEFTDLVFEPGDTSKTLMIEVLPDNVVELDEMFFVNLLSASNAVIAENPPAQSNHVTIEIINDDAAGGIDYGPWNIRFSDTQYFIDEPDAGNDTALITLLRAPGSSYAIAVFFTTNGTATAGSDYDAVFRQLVVFGENQLSITVPITVHSDALAEGNETVRLWLRNPTGGPVNGSPDAATLTIIDEDTPAVSITPTLSISEGSLGINTFWTFEVTLSQVSAVNVTVLYETISLTARAGQDFTAISGSVTIPAGSLTVPLINKIKVGVFGDLNAELSETFAVRISNATNASLDPDDSVAVATINDDDGKEISGEVFYDSNGNGFKDLDEKGVKDVDVKIDWFDAGVAQTITVQTNASGIYKTNVFLGQVSITVDGTSLTSPYQDTLAGVSGSGEYELTTDNDTQTIEFDGVVGISPFEDVGFKNSTTSDSPSGSKDTGRGGTDDTIFGGPGNDVIDAGAGDDHIVGGHWMTATDSNAPINKGDYDAVVTAVTAGLHVVYDSGPIFQVNTSGLSAGGSISGQIWRDTNNNHIQNGVDPLFLTEVVVHLFDGSGNPVNSLVTTTGSYIFNGLFLNEDGSDSTYIIQFELPAGYAFVSPNAAAENADSDAISGGRTMKYTFSLADPTEVDVDAGLRPSNTVPSSASGGFEFEDPSYNVSENVESGFVTVTVVRGTAFEARAVVVRTRDGVGVDAGLKGVNYQSISAVLFFDVGETSKTVSIPIIDSNTLDFCTTRHFNLELRDPTGRLLNESVVYIFGDGAGTISDDDDIDGNKDWDIALGDSGVIPATAVIAIPASLNNIVYSGGPGRDVITGGDGPDFINGQLFGDILSGNEGRDTVRGEMGNDLIIVELDDDTIDGGHGTDTILSTRDVPVIELTTTGATTAVLVHRTAALVPLSTFSLTSIEVAKLYGGYQANTFDITGWNGSAFISGDLGQDTLLVENDTNMIVADATPAEALAFLMTHGFLKRGSINLPVGAIYHFGGLEKIVLSGGPSANTLTALNYSGPLSLQGLGGDDVLIGGAGRNIFLFDADAALGTDVVWGNGDIDLIDFTGTLADVTVNLSVFNPTVQTVNSNLKLVLIDAIEHLTGGSGDDDLTGNSLNNVLLGGPGNDRLAGGAGNETYVFDTDLPWGHETIVEDAGGGNDTIDFSGTSSLAISINLSLTGLQIINANLTLTVQDSGGAEGEIENVRGGTLHDTIRGNTFDNNLFGGPGHDILDGKSGDDFLNGGPGNDDLEGGLGTDRISETADTNFTLTDSQLIRGTGETDTLHGIEIAQLLGGTSANTFNLSGWTGTGSINGNDAVGAPRLDTVIVARDANFILTNASLTISTNLGAIALTSIDRATLTGGPGNNTLDASAFTGAATLRGGDGHDVLIGGAGADILQGGLGNDQLTGNGGNDQLDGGADTDALIETRNATLFVVTNTQLLIDLTFVFGDEQIDTLSNFESVELNGGAGANTFDVSSWTAGLITLNGLGGVDRVQTTISGTVTLTDTLLTFTGGAGTIVLSSIEAATLTGGNLPDVFIATAFSGSTILRGNGGNDTFHGAKGTDAIDAGTGDDTIHFIADGIADTNFIVGGDGIDTLDFSAFTTGITLNLGTIGFAQVVAPGELSIAFLTEDIENVIGTNAIDSITGNSLNNRLTGLGGADNLDGAGGTNTVVETRDANFVLTNASLNIGGTIDSLANITVAELTGGTSINLINASAFTGTTILSGGANNDTLQGGSGSNRYIGGAGNDMLIGAGGSDIYEFDADSALGADTITDSGGTDQLDFALTTTVGVQVDLSITGALQVVHVTNLSLTLSGATVIENLIGGAQADILRGNSANNGFIGGLGADTINGGSAGTDIIVEIRDSNFTLTNTSLVIGGETDTLAGVEQAFLVGGAGHNTLDASLFTLGTVSLAGLDGNDILIGGDADDTLNGGNGHDFLYGNEGLDTLRGLDGNDFLSGGGDNDDLRGGLGNDSYFFDQSFDQGSDTIVEFAGEGFADVLLGVGIAGIDFDLFLTTLQAIGPNLDITLTNAGQVEFSF